MQVLYAMSRDKKLSYEAAMTRYRNGIQKSFELYLFCLLSFIKITEYSKKDAEKKLSKLRPTEEDKAFTPKLFENPLIQAVVNNSNLQGLFKRHKIEERISDDNIRSLYIEFAKSDAYKEYLKSKDNSANTHRQLLLNLYKFCQQSELFVETLEDNFLSYVDDKSLVIGSMKKTIKAWPTSSDFHEEYRPTEETTKDFGEILLHKVNTQDKELLDMIEPTLKNWDADRVAIIDMILLKMALSNPSENEFLDLIKTMCKSLIMKDFMFQLAGWILV